MFLENEKFGHDLIENGLIVRNVLMLFLILYVLVSCSGLDISNLFQAFNSEFQGR